MIAIRSCRACSAVASVTFSSGDPTVRLTSVIFDLAPTGVFLDTNLLTAPGAALALDLSLVTGAATTGFTSLSTPGTRDGATSYTLAFTDFAPGESFGYEMDVDECSINDILDPLGSLDCSLVNGAEFAGAKVTFVFDMGSGTATFVDRTSTFQHWDAIATFSGDIPEPTTWTMLGSALAAAAVLRLRRR